MTPDDIEPLLPELFARMLPRSEVLQGLLASMAALLDPYEHAHESLLGWLDPRTAPAEVLPMLCRWVGMDPELCEDEQALRRLISIAPSLTARRGTADALRMLLETCMGARGFSIEPSPERPHAVVIRAPQSLRDRAHRIEAIVRAGKPAHVSHELAWEAGA